MPSPVVIELPGYSKLPTVHRHLPALNIAATAFTTTLHVALKRMRMYREQDVNPHRSEGKRNQTVQMDIFYSFSFKRN